MLYFLLKCIHIFSVVVALGANLTYGFLLNRAHQNPQHLVFVLKTVQWIDKKIANRSYIITLVTGLVLVWKVGYPLSALWVWFSLSLFIVIAILGITVYGPILRRQIDLVEQNQLATTAYQKIKRKSNGLGIFVTLLVLIILFMMVVKPTIS
jgi:uncharacterized membrane protein